MLNLQRGRDRVQLRQCLGNIPSKGIFSLLYGILGYMGQKLYAIQSIALAVGIVIVLNLFVNFGIRTFYPPLKYEQFCEETKAAKAYNDQVSCEGVGGFWYEPGANPHGGPYPARPVIGEKYEPQGWCDPNYQCNKDFQTSREIYNRNVFIVLVIAGVIALGVGLFIKAATAVSTGFIFGGVISLIVGTIRYWSDMQEYLRFIILGIALVILVWIGYKKLRSV